MPIGVTLSASKCEPAITLTDALILAAVGALSVMAMLRQPTNAENTAALPSVADVAFLVFSIASAASFATLVASRSTSIISGRDASIIESCWRAECTPDEANNVLKSRESS